MILEKIEVGAFQVNCYILAEGPKAQAVIIDPGDEEDKIRKQLAKNGLIPEIIVNTHGHIDHIGCDGRFGVPVYIHAKDAPMLGSPEYNLSSFLASPFRVEAGVRIMEVNDKDIIRLGGIELEVIHTPGHTPGGICLRLNESYGKIMFTGDSLFYRGIGRTDFPGASQEALLRAIKEKIMILDDDIVIYPGHGPSSTIGDERKRNSFLK